MNQFNVLTIICLLLGIQQAQAQFTLQVLHASDLEGGVEAIEAAPNFAAIVDTLEGEYPNTLILSSGDNWLPGPFFAASNQFELRDTFNAVYNDFYNVSTFNNLREAGGRVDVSIMNIIGFDAACFGNHEFDAGTSAIEDIIGSDIRNNGTDARWLGAQFPYLSANLDFSASNLGGLYTPLATLPTDSFFSDPLNWPAAADAPKIAPSAIVELSSGVRVGIVAATTQLLATISSPGDVAVIGGGSNDMAQLAGLLQPYIDSMTTAGVDAVIVMSHLQQFTLEQQLAGLLNDVDIIIAGGSDYLLADNNDVLRPGDVAADNYPFATFNADGDSCLIVSTDGQYSYVGRLVVAFDANGNVLPSSVDANVSGAFATLPAVVNTVWGSENPFATGTKGQLVQRLTNTVNQIVVSKDGNILGYTNVFLDGRRNTVRSQEANLGNLTADANLWQAKQHDPSTLVSIKNGGGIRAEIGEVVETSPGVYELLPPQDNPVSGKLENQVSQLDIENSLKFNNELSLLDLSANDLKEIIEHGLGSYAPGATPGSFCQVAGIRVSFDPTQPSGSRIQNMAIVNGGQVLDSIVVNGSVHGDTSRIIRVVTLNFLASGGDGYDFDILGQNRVDLPNVLTTAGNFTFADPGSEQDALAEYLNSEYSSASLAYDEAETAPEFDTRIQILSLRSDSVFTLTVGTEEAEAQAAAGMILYPNPTQNILQIETQGAELRALDIIDLNGRLVRQENNLQGTQARLQLADLPQGMYLIRVQSEHGLETFKLLKQ